MIITYNDILNKFNGKDEFSLGDYRFYTVGPARSICIEDVKTGYDIATSILSDDSFENSKGWVKIHINSITKKEVKKPVSSALANALSELENLEFENKKNSAVKQAVSTSSINNDIASIKTFKDLKNIITSNGEQIQNDKYDDGSRRNRYKYSIKSTDYILLSDSHSDGSVSEWIYFEKDGYSINNANFYESDSFQYLQDTNSWKKISYNSFADSTCEEFITGSTAKALNLIFGIKEVKKSKKEKDDAWYKVFAEVIESKYNSLDISSYKDVSFDKYDKPDSMFEKLYRSGWYLGASDFDIPTRNFHALMKQLNLLEQYETKGGNKYYRPTASRKEASATRNECVITFFYNHGYYTEFCEFYNVKEIFEKVLKKDGKYTPSDIENYYE